MTISFKDVENQVAAVDYEVKVLTTICHISTKFGMNVVGVAHCQCESIFDESVGKGTAYSKAIDELFPLVIAYEKGKSAK